MSNVFDHGVPRKSERHVPPPIGPDGIQHTLEARARQARAEALGAALRWTGAGFLRALEGVLNFVRCGGYGIAKRVPHGSTTPCR